MVAAQEENEELLLSCRYGDLKDVQDFVIRYGAPALADARDDHGNNVLHMTCANGHVDVLEYLLPLVPSPLLAQQNHAGSTPLHWAALNRHLQVTQKLVQHPGGPGIDLIDIKNAMGRSPLGEAEMAEWDEGARWFVQVMNIDEVKQEESDEQVDPSQTVEIEIQDAEGQIASMSINNTAQALSSIEGGQLLPEDQKS
ncbi:ankyrin repeat-containing domain protein [Pisolithus sp. B1]|nr:ankyrin repeat-containing domain protein [Pisolithus sp. B1]